MLNSFCITPEMQKIRVLKFGLFSRVRGNRRTHDVLVLSLMKIICKSMVTPVLVKTSLLLLVILCL